MRRSVLPALLLILALCGCGHADHAPAGGERLTVETSNLGRDNIPSFRILFREYDWELDEEA